MTKDEVKEIHSRHKRETLFADGSAVKRKEEFEVNMEEEDEDFAGPSLTLYEGADMQIASGDRNRKQKEIARKVQDFEDS
jgi:hypothetical protein